MSPRKASGVLGRIIGRPPLVEASAPAAEARWLGLDWQGPVSIAADRAGGTSAAHWQAHVRTGLLERALVIGADHREGPHTGRPESGRRILAHMDALAEAGLSIAELPALAENADLEQAGALWLFTILFGCFEETGADEAFEAWVASLDASLFLDYRAVLEIADALASVPDSPLLHAARRWHSSASPVLRAIALETIAIESLPGDVLSRVASAESPLVQVAFERLVYRSPDEFRRSAPRRPSWMVGVPALSFELARVRLLQNDVEPLVLLRRGDLQALGALEARAMDLLALAGDASDEGLACDLLRGFETTPALLAAVGLSGHPALFPRLLAELESDDFDDEARAALVTALGPRLEDTAGGRKPITRSRAAWEQAVTLLPKSAEPRRYRAGEPHRLPAVLGEMKRIDLSARELANRADEVCMMTGKRALVSWEAFGISCEGALSELARLAR